MLRIIIISLFLCPSLFSTEIIIGKYDKVDLPLLDLKNLRAKVDTGARTSSLHCSYINSSDNKYVTFDVLDKSHKKYEDKKYTLPIVRIAKVRSSNGIIENRYVVSSKLVIFDKAYDVEFTLRDRKKMNYPILLGRKFLKNGFLVDVRKEDLSFKQKNIK